jgi:hypothetical protein
VNNDGYDDLIVGASYNDAGGSDAGRAYVYSGQTGGLLWTFTGEAASDRLGWSVSGAGDVDDDGHDDLIVGARYNDAGGSAAGRAYVYSGQTGGLLWTFTGEAAGDRLGTSVSEAGDVNDDGYGDVIVGARNNDAGGSNAGRAYVYSGQTGGLLWTFTGEGSSNYFGHAVSGAGDVDDDGYDDLIVSAPSNDAGGTDAGRAYVYSGQTGSRLVRFTGGAAGDRMAWSVSGAGDVNNDGYDDLIVGACCQDAGGTDAGRAYVYSGVGYQADCLDISPEAGVIVQHDQIGRTYRDMQHRGKMGRTISVAPGGCRHFSWTWSMDHPSSTRHVDANCKRPDGTYLAQTHADSNPRAGFSSQTHLLAAGQTGISVIAHDRLLGSVEPNYTTLTIEDSECQNLFTRHWDIPDYIGVVNGDAEHAHWPKAEVQNVTSALDYIHVVMTHGDAVDGLAALLAYERCYLGQADTLICETFYEASQRMYKAPVNECLLPSYDYPVSHFDTSCGLTPVVVVSQTSRVAVPFLKPACPEDVECDYFSDVCYIESMDYGDDWVEGTDWPPSEYNITNYGCEGTERALYDLNACYDYEDSLHIVYVTGGFESSNPGHYQAGVARLYHWSKKTGVVMITSAIWEETNPPTWDANISKISISAMDPIYHPDSNYLYCIWTQFDPGDDAFNGYSNGDIYGAGSRDGGSSWGPSHNLTNTKTPNCLSGDCLSEHWASLALNMRDGYLHIQYICDRDAGAAVESEGEWTSNPVMYLELEAWDPGTSYLRGDANGDGIINVGDIVYLVSYLYKSGPAPDPIWVGDCNCDEIVNVGDVVYLVSYLYKGGPAPGCP